MATLTEDAMWLVGLLGRGLAIQGVYCHRENPETTNYEAESRFVESDPSRRRLIQTVQALADLPDAEWPECVRPATPRN